jgi:hypothetical protein
LGCMPLWPIPGGIVRITADSSGRDTGIASRRTAAESAGAGHLFHANHWTRQMSKIEEETAGIAGGGGTGHWEVGKYRRDVGAALLAAYCDTD